MIGATAILALFFLIWSIALRHLAVFLIKDCTHKSIKTPIFLSIDIVATIWWLFAAYQITNFLFAHFILLSALWITIHTDFSQMLISRFVSLYLIPFGLFFSIMNLLPISPFESVLTSIFGYGFFWIANKIFYILKKHDGLGQGDLELIAMIGSFTGFLGCWFTILFASTTGTICAGFYLIFTHKKIQILPFGPFLAIGSMIFVLFQDTIVYWLLS
ncbi:prepilin peptidase [Candidatus Babeliales bacterium]|nr:prepilin peptidase [Candidatus Babeliales bacterium]